MPADFCFYASITYWHENFNLIIANQLFIKKNYV
jgi:hypothetical protein